MDEDDLPLANYLLQLNEEDELSESDDNEDVFGTEEGTCGQGAPIEVVDLDSDEDDLAELVGEKVGQTHCGKDTNKAKPRTQKSVGNTQELKDRNRCPIENHTKEYKIEATPSKSVRTPAEFKRIKAIKAKEQRERKKKYIVDLNDTVEELKRDKAGFQRVTAQLNCTIKELKDEISYLKGIIANQSELASILKSVSNTPGIEVSCTFLQDDWNNSNAELSDGKKNKRKRETIEGCSKHGVKRNNSNEKRKKFDHLSNCENGDAGVCVHVRSGKVSLEFCAECSRKASVTTESVN